MFDWQPMATVPKGSWRTVEAHRGTREVHQPEYVILALAENNFVMRSRWLPEEERWEGTSKDKNTPIGWLPWPTHPNEQQDSF